MFIVMYLQSCFRARSKGNEPDVLLVEDSVVSQKIATLALGKAFYKVVVATAGLEAVEAFKQHRSSLKIILMDIGVRLASFSSFAYFLV